MFADFKKWIKKGIGEFVGFSFSALIITSILIIIIGAVTLHNAQQYMNAVARQLARDIIVCEDLEDAQKTAQRNAEAYVKYKPAIRSVRTEVSYIPGTEEEEWKKGNFVTITLTCRISSISPFTTGVYDDMVTMMIERTEDKRFSAY